MIDPPERAGYDDLPPSPRQSVSGEFISNTGIAGNIIEGDAINVTKDIIEEAIRDINGSEARTAFSLFWNVPLKKRGVVLCGVRFDKGVGLIAKMRESEGLDAVVTHLAEIDENRLAEFLGPEGVSPQLCVEVSAALSAEKLRVLLAKLGAAHPVSAARLVEQLAAAEPVLGRHTGPHAAIAVLPAERADRLFLARVPPTKGTAGLLAGLPEDERKNLLLGLSSQDLRDLLILATRANIEALIEVLPEDRAVQELNQLTSHQLTPLVAPLSVNRSARLMELISPDLVGAVLSDGSVDGAPWLEHIGRRQAVEILGKMQPVRAAACLRRVRTGTAAELLRLPDVPDDWVPEVLAALPARLRAALLDRVATDSQAAADRLSPVLQDGWEPATTGWPRIDALLTMLMTVYPAVRRLGPRFRGTEPLSSALGKEVADARGLWRGMRQSSAARPINYRAQRNLLAVALSLALVALVCVILTR